MTEHLLIMDELDNGIFVMHDYTVELIGKVNGDKGAYDVMLVQNEEQVIM